MLTSHRRRPPMVWRQPLVVAHLWKCYPRRHSVSRGSATAHQRQSVTRPHLRRPRRMSSGGEKRLRLRLRVADTSQRCKVDVPAACTLQQLQSALRVELPTLDADFDVSLNKKVRPLCGIIRRFLGHVTRMSCLLSACLNGVQ